MMRETIQNVPLDILLTEEIRRIRHPDDFPPVCRDLERYYRHLVQVCQRTGEGFYRLAQADEQLVASFIPVQLVSQESRTPLIPVETRVLMMNPSGKREGLPEEYQTRNFLMRSDTGSYYAGSVHRDLTCTPLRTVNALHCYRTPDNAWGDNLKEVLDYHFLI